MKTLSSTITRGQMPCHYFTYQRLDAKKALMGMTHVAYLSNKKDITHKNR